MPFRPSHRRLAVIVITTFRRTLIREIVYRQEVETDKPVSGYSLRVLRKSMGEFAQDLDDYLRRSDLVRDGGEAPPRG